MNSPPSRTSWYTNTKLLAQNRLLSPEQLRQIPRTNVHRWKSEPADKYRSVVGSTGSHDYDLLREFVTHKAAYRTFAAYVRIMHSLGSIAHQLKEFHQKVTESRMQIVQLVRRTAPLIGLRNVLRFFNISTQTFRQWALQSATNCFESMTGLCNRFYPNQLSTPQVLLMKELMLKPEFQYWPVSSIALHALRENLLPLSLNTWYKYVNRLGLKKAKPNSRRNKSATGIRATLPNQIWHADITVFVTADRIKHFIYCVVDNFSRKILTCEVHSVVSAAFRRKTISDAFDAFSTDHPSVTLITDGGPENNFNFASTENLIVHRKALIDIQYSNSLIEAHNKILKYNYLYRMIIENGDQLRAVIPKIVTDFNDRPHISLNGLTPNEAERGIQLDRNKLTQFIKQSTAERKEYNRNHQCGRCPV